MFFFFLHEKNLGESLFFFLLISVHFFFLLHHQIVSPLQMKMISHHLQQREEERRNKSEYKNLKYSGCDSFFSLTERGSFFFSHHLRFVRAQTTQKHPSFWRQKDILVLVVVWGGKTTQKKTKTSPPKTKYEVGDKIVAFFCVVKPPKPLPPTKQHTCSEATHTQQQNLIISSVVAEWFSFLISFSILSSRIIIIYDQNTCQTWG